jgi:bacterioferritin (cytochrome b1)
MTSVIDGLNELLCRERGEVEAVANLIKEIRRADPDIADSARDALETASWSCQGLYHRIDWLGGTPTMDAEDHLEQMEELQSTKEKIEFICSTQKADSEKTRALLEKPILDKDTRDLLENLLRAHEGTMQWCKATLAEWEVPS